MKYIIKRFSKTSFEERQYTRSDVKALKAIYAKTDGFKHLGLLGENFKARDVVNLKHILEELNQTGKIKNTEVAQKLMEKMGIQGNVNHLLDKFGVTEKGIQMRKRRAAINEAFQAKTNRLENTGYQSIDNRYNFDRDNILSDMDFFQRQMDRRMERRWEEGRRKTDEYINESTKLIDASGPSWKNWENTKRMLDEKEKLHNQYQESINDQVDNIKKKIDSGLNEYEQSLEKLRQKRAKDYNDLDKELELRRKILLEKRNRRNKAERLQGKLLLRLKNGLNETKGISREVMNNYIPTQEDRALSKKVLEHSQKRRKHAKIVDSDSIEPMFDPNRNSVYVSAKAHHPQIVTHEVRHSQDPNVFYQGQSYYPELNNVASEIYANAGSIARMKSLGASPVQLEQAGDLGVISNTSYLNSLAGNIIRNRGQLV